MNRNQTGGASLRIASSILAIAGAAAFPGPAFAAEERAAAAGEAAEDDGNVIVVVGSRSGNAKALESSAPIQVVGGDELRGSGALNLSEGLQETVPSFHFPTSAPGTSAVHFVKGVSLRGLAADQTLVLIDGKRRHATAQLNPNSGGFFRGAQTVDLSSIPLSAIERVEVLLDGASAQYGSDAIAGVVNIVLKKAPRSGDIALQYLGNEKGDGETKSVEGSIGFALPGDGSLTIGFDAWDIAPTRLAVTDTRQMYFAGDPREATYPLRDWFYGTGASKRQNLIVNAETQIGAVTAYALGSFGWRKDEGSGNLRMPRANETVRALFPDGFVPTLKVRSRDASIGGGLRWSSAAAGDFDLSANYGYNRVKSLTGNTNNASMGTASPTTFDTGDLLNEQINVTLDWKRPFEVGFLSRPLHVAAGVAYRREAYEIFEGDYGSWANGGVLILDGPNAGRIATPGSQGFGGFSPEDAGRLTRNVVGGYVELEASLSDRFRVTTSAGLEKYSDFGWTTNARLALRYEVTNSLAWRGSTGTGYRAPSLGQIGFTRTLPNIASDVLTSRRVAQVNSPLARALGATPLESEKSFNLSTGLVWTPSADLSATVDIYQTKIKNRILLSETLTGALVEQILADAGFPTFSGASYFANAVDTRTRGVDAMAHYRHRFGDDHQLRLTIGFNWSKTKITDQKDVPAVLANSGLTLVGREVRGLLEEVNPDTTLRAAADYTLGRFEANLSAVRYGAYWARHPTSAALDQRFSPQIVTNVSASYRVLGPVRLVVGVRNLFDTYPDDVIPGARNPVVSYVSRLAPEGGAGRIFYGRVEYNF